MQLAEQSKQKWSPVLDHPDLPEIKDTIEDSYCIVLRMLKKSDARQTQLVCCRRHFRNFQGMTTTAILCWKGTYSRKY